MEGYRFVAQLHRIAPIGLLPEGLRIDLGFDGDVVEGPLAGGTIEGVDYLLVRPDGVGVVDARELLTGSDGTTVSAHAEGYVVPPFEIPELSALVDPSFLWPDVDLALHGSARLQSAAPALAAVNRTVYSFTGTVNMATGSLEVAGSPVTEPSPSRSARLGASVG